MEAWQEATSEVVVVPIAVLVAVVILKIARRIKTLALAITLVIPAEVLDLIPLESYQVEFKFTPHK